MNSAEQQAELIDLTKELIRIPSTNSRPDQIQKCDQWIQAWLTNRNIQFTSVLHNNVPSLLVLPEKNYTPVLLMSHYDVVEAENLNLFKPIERNGNLYGRGAIDDKYGVALSLTLFDNHLRQLEKYGKGQSSMQFGLLLTGDEEIGGANGTAKAIDHFSTDFFITIDGGSPELIVTKEKGILLLELIAHGKSAHAARPWLGENAFEILARDYAHIQDYFKDQKKDHWNKTVSLTQCSAGTCSTNMVPGTARALLDIRYTEQDDPDVILKDIRKNVASHVQVMAKEPVFSSGKSPYLDCLLAQASNARTGCEHGASDARYLASRGIPGVIWGADGQMSQHTEDEHLVISSLFDIYGQLDNFLRKLPG